MKSDMKRSLEHISETNEIRKILWHMDEKVEDLSFGIRQGDDCMVVGDMVMNMEGPYPLKTGRKTGLIHTCSDIVVMGGRPLFAMNAMQVDSIEEAMEVAEDLKKQSNGLGVPIIGGNTQMENDLAPCISFTVFGRLVREAIADSGMQAKDRLFMLGEILDGPIGERVFRAKTRYETFLDLCEKKVQINAAKDASRGGWFGNMAEMLIKSRKGVEITSIPYPRISRYMGTYLVSVPEKDAKKVVEICARHKCPVIEFGKITQEIEIKMGDETVVEEPVLADIIRNFPFRPPKTKK